MVATRISRRTVFRHIAKTSYYEWPAYTGTPLYDRSSTSGLAEDIRTLASVWFEHDAHDSIEEFVCYLPLNYVEFRSHDRFTGEATYSMDQLFRMFLLKELRGWEHETALLTYLEQRHSLHPHFGFETLPDQSTLWRSWHKRFTAELRSIVETAAQTILIKAQNAGVAFPREPEQSLLSHGNEADESAPDDQAVLNEAAPITEHVSHIVFPAFSLSRGDGCEIHENAYWDLQTYLGLREGLAANEGARSFGYESNRDRTPLGHAHREHIRDLSIEGIREMYRQAINRFLTEVAETKEFFRAGIVAIDITEADPYTGDRTGYEDEIIGTKENTDKYAYQWATVQLVGNAVPIVLDARSVREGETRKEIVEDLLDSDQGFIHIDEVLMDREFDSQHVLEAVSERGLKYVVPKRMHTSEKAQAKRLLKRDQDHYTTDRKLHLGNDEWFRLRWCICGKRTPSERITTSTRYS